MSQEPSTGPLPEGLGITRRVVDGALVVAVTGEIDMETAPVLRAAVSDVIDEPGSGSYVLDLTAVTFLGSAGLGALLEATQHAGERHEPLRIVVDGNRPVIRPIEVTGLDDVLALYHSVGEALESDKQS